MVYLITYDLHRGDRDYEDVIATIKTFGAWAHIEESVWLVDTTLSTGACRDGLQAVTTDATLFVIRVQRDWASQGLSGSLVTWLKDPTRDW